MRRSPARWRSPLAFVTFSGSASNSPLSLTLTGRGVSADIIFKNGFDQ
jgi:hypothetical protein